nr:MAG: putative RNA-dependent RNA polymerase [Magoulivirus sp.]
MGVVVDRVNTPAFSIALRSSLDLLAENLAVFQALVPRDCVLELPASFTDAKSLPTLKSVKEFCVGLLENPVSHPWWKCLRSVEADARMSIAGSLFLHRKTLPCPPSPWSAHRDRVCSSPVEVPNDYLRFVRRTVRKLFPAGWDREYGGFVERFLPPLSSCTSHSRSKGGSRAAWAGRVNDFQKACILGDFRVPDEFNVNFMNVDLDGKSRSVTVAGASQAILGPLHRTIYSRLSQRDWLLRGKAKRGSFVGFESRPDHVFVSGDYESATDNLSLEVAEEIVRTLSESSEIPESVWEFALVSLRARITYPLEGGHCTFDQVRGQLMGNLLSFPLLCIQNYTAFKYLVRGPVPVRINGDDIVFRAPLEVAKEWMAGVNRLGLTLSVGKTMIHRRYFSLNSTFFKARSSGRIDMVPVLRSACLTRPQGLPASLAASFRSFSEGMKGEPLITAQIVFCRRKSLAFAALGRSLLRDLGMNVEVETLRRLGWLRREAWMLSSELPCSLPAATLDFDQSCVPSGWRRRCLPAGRRERKLLRERESEFFDELTANVWSSTVTPVKVLQLESWKEAKGTSLNPGWRYFASHCRSRKRLLRGLKLTVDLGLPARFIFPRRGERVWCRDEPLKFVRFVGATVAQS